MTQLTPNLVKILEHAKKNGALYVNEYRKPDMDALVTLGYMKVKLFSLAFRAVITDAGLKYLEDLNG